MLLRDLLREGAAVYASYAYVSIPKCAVTYICWIFQQSVGFRVWITTNPSSIDTYLACIFCFIGGDGLWPWHHVLAACRDPWLGDQRHIRWESSHWVNMKPAVSFALLLETLLPCVIFSPSFFSTMHFSATTPSTHFISSWHLCT